MTALASIYLGHPLRVLALWQPWATLLVAPDPDDQLRRPPKRHETRHWYPTAPLPLYVAIHAAKMIGKDNRPLFTAPRFREALKRCGYYPGNPEPLLKASMATPGLKPCPLGAIIGVGVVSRIRALVAPLDAAVKYNIQALTLDELTPDDHAFGFFEGKSGDEHPYRYAWEITDTVELPEPVLHTGRQDALYFLDLQTQEAVHSQLRSLANG
jgi:hypothetical protein